MLGIDTTFLLAHELAEIPAHGWAREKVREAGRKGERQFALAPQVLSEFLHVATDPRRFQTPLGMEEALDRAGLWWEGKEVWPLIPGAESVRLCLCWLREHRLGRKRLLDTQLAAAFWEAGVRRILTQNRKDFEVFGVFQVEEFGG